MESLMTIGELEQQLLTLYPREDAEAWDKTGLILGDPSQPVQGVLVALDPTIPAVEQAKRLGANVLVTHHPPFLKAPETYKPASSIAVEEGALVFAAAQAGVALMCFHTALDHSVAALKALPMALGLQFQKTLLPLNVQEPAGKGYGAVCAFNDAAELMTAGSLARACASAFGGTPRIWGDPCAGVCSVVTAQGSAAEAGYEAVRQGVDCLVCGELKYHDALPLSQAGLTVIELGHDKSELPLAHLLYEVVCSMGFDNVGEMVQDANWTCV